MYNVLAVVHENHRYAINCKDKGCDILGQSWTYIITTTDLCIYIVLKFSLSVALVN